MQGLVHMVAIAIVGCAGCGRLGFESQAAPDALAAPAADAPADAPVPTPRYHYRLDGSYAEAGGGPALVGQGGGFDATGYRFPENQGLQLPGGMPVAVYTIDVVLAFDQLISWRKIIDFKALGVDEGLYAYDAQLGFVESASPVIVYPGLPEAPNPMPEKLVASVPGRVTLRRDAAGTVTGYVNGVQELSFTDSRGMATFTVGGRADFGVDDVATVPREAPAGVIRAIRIWDVALTPGQIDAL